MKFLNPERKLQEMARVGETENGCTVCVYSNEGNLPHMHLYIGNPKNPIFESCIRIDEPLYFNHKPHMKKLNSEDKKDLIKFLNSKHKLGIKMWEYIQVLWNDNNPKYVWEGKMPNYKDLE